MNDNLLLSTIDNLDYGIIIFNTDGKIEFINQYALVITGFERENLEYNNIENVFFISHCKECKDIKSIQKELKNKNIFVYESKDCKLLNSKGIEIPIEFKVGFLTDNDGRIIEDKYIVTFRDIDYYKRILSNIKNSASILKNIFDYTPVAIFILDIYYNIININTEGLKLLGVDEKFINDNKYFFNYINDEYTEPLKNILLEIKEERKVKKNIEIIVKSKESENIYCDFSISIYYDILNQPKYYIIMANNISELKKSRNDCALEARKYKSLFYNMTSGFVLLFLEKNNINNFDLKIIDYNETFKTIFDIKENEIYNKKIIGDLKLNFFNEIQDIIINTMNTNTPNLIKDIKCNNKYLTIRCFIPFNNHIALIINDTTERKNLEDSLYSANRELERALEREYIKNLDNEQMLAIQSRNAMLGEMIGHITHQWRQPLNGLYLLIQNIEYMINNDEYDKKQMLEMIKKTKLLAEVLTTTIDDFKDFIKTERLKNVFIINKTIKKSINIVNSSIKDSSIKLTYKDTNEIKIIGYENELMHVIINIILNSRDAFIERKIKEPEIIIELKDNDDKVNLIIKDNAGGIDESLLDKVFEKYWTTKPNGTGLGLYMSKIIIEEHFNGKILLKNKDNGLETTIELIKFKQ